MPTHYQSWELGKVYFQNQGSDVYETHEYYKNNIISTIYLPALLDGQGGGRVRYVIKNVLIGDFAVTDGTVKPIQGASYIVDTYYVYWNLENIIQLKYYSTSIYCTKHK